jgi:hypothetical protein
VHVRVDEGGSEEESRPRLLRRLDLRDHAVLDRDVERLVDPLDRVEHTRALENEAVVVAVPREQHHATSCIASTGTGLGTVSRS